MKKLVPTVLASMAVAVCCAFPAVAESGDELSDATPSTMASTSFLASDVIPYGAIGGCDGIGSIKVTYGEPPTRWATYQNCLSSRATITPRWHYSPSGAYTYGVCMHLESGQFATIFSDTAGAAFSYVWGCV